MQYCTNDPELSASYNADYKEDCRRTISVNCSSNKKGIAAKKELVEKFFPKTEDILNVHVAITEQGKQIKKHHCGNCNYGHWFSGANTYINRVDHHTVCDAIRRKDWDRFWYVKEMQGKVKCDIFNKLAEEIIEDKHPKKPETANETPENDVETIENVNEIAISVNDISQLESFDYSALDTDTAEYLQQKVENLRIITLQTMTDIGRELSEAQDKLAKHGYGCFETWYTYLGFKKDNVYNLINRYRLVCRNPDKQDLIESLPKTIVAEIAKPTAVPELREAVFAGGVKTHKDYKELEEKLKAEAKDKKYWMEQANIASDQRDTERKQREALLQEKLNVNKNVRDLQKQLAQAKRNGNQKQIGNLNMQLAEKNRQLKEKPIEVSATREIEVIPDEVKDLIYKKVLLAIEAIKFLTDKEIDIFIEAIDPDWTEDIAQTIASARRKLNGIWC